MLSRRPRGCGIMWAWPRWCRTTVPFLLSTRALSLKCRGLRELLDVELVAQPGGPMVDVLRGVIGVEAHNPEGEGL